MEKQKFTLDQINELINVRGFGSCLCKDEFEGGLRIGTDTIQISKDLDSEYFGEFVGSPDADEYEFIMYIY